MKRNTIQTVIASIVILSLSSCSGMLLSTDFGFDDYGPNNGLYWPTYGSIYDGPGGFFGPAWNLTPPPPPRPVYPNRPRPGFNPSNPPSNGANRPNFAPQQPTTTTPSGAQRPGNMGQGPVHTPGTNTNGSSATHRGR